MEADYKKVISSKKAEAKKLMTKDQVAKCNGAIHFASVATGLEAFVPVPGVDAVPITMTQITMIITLGKVFGQKVSESAAKAIISAAASTFVGRSLVKLIPGVGWAASSAVAIGVTEAIGWTAAVDFANQSSKIRLAEVEAMEKIANESGVVDEGTISDDETEAEYSVVESNGFEKSVEEKFPKDDCGEETAEDNQDDESISNDFSKMFGED